MFSKKTILILTVLILLFSVVSFVNAIEQRVREIGGDRASLCTKSGDVWECECQGAIKKDKAGKIIRDKEGNITEISQGNDAGGEIGKLITDPICAFCGDCTLNNFLGLGVNISNIILKYLGVFALLMFVIGGVIWITSGGSSEKVQLGKKTISGAVVGMVIVLGAVLIVRVVGDLVGVDVEKYLVVEEAKKGEAPPVSEEEKEGWDECLPPAEKNWCYNCFGYGTDNPETSENEARGCQGNDVAVYQSILNDLGCKCGMADGKFGFYSKKCTKKFQEEFNKFLESEGYFRDQDKAPLLPSTDGGVDDKIYSYVVLRTDYPVGNIKNDMRPACAYGN
ncbi:pilin [Patescibacteria group bacterium AH-259-L07]|nr:pilin [Patescibacteria group bacterium AH-259-L07]